MTAAWCAAVLGAIACAEDLRSRRVPNWLTCSGIAAGLLCAAAAGWRSVIWSAAGAAIGFVLLLPLHLRRGLGGGDVKLLAAYGALLGPSGIVAAAIFGAIVGALWGAVATLRGARTIPYAPAIVAGAWIQLIGGGS